MVNTCSAYGCKNSALTFGKHFFTFPKDPVLRKKWIIKTKRANFNPSSTAALCSDHFNETDFELRTRPSFLRSILLPEEQIKKVKLSLIPGTIPSNFNFPHKDLCTALDSGNNRKGLDLDFDKTSNGPVGTKTAKIRGAVLKRERLRVLAEIDFGTKSSNSSQNIPSKLSKSSNDGSVSDICSISQPSQIISESERLVLQGNEIPPSSKRNDIPANSKEKVLPPRSKGNVIQPRGKGNVIRPRSKSNVIQPRGKGNVIPPRSKSNVIPSRSKSNVIPSRSKGNVILPSSSKGPKGILILETLKSQNNERQPSGRSILFLKRLESQESHVSQPSQPVSTDTLLHRTDCYTLKSILKDNTTDLVHQKSSTPKQDIPCNVEEETVMTEDLRNEINNDSHNNTTVTLPQPAKESYTEEYCDIDVKEEVLEECLDTALTDTLTQSLIMTCETAEDESLCSEITDFVDVNRVSRFDCYDHFPAKAKRKARRCQREGCRRKSLFYCRKCREFLCIVATDTEDDCFYLYHHQ
ncbi:uncharacterized protein LOC106066865 isoform X1 [Biomphalaria glabrata]|uniref:Uncharacterized protein LOC106066865 isoform X1 n=1 Tax=Biomphalaria glabrata TaxID=6526 RepID=A0A9W2YPN6_BIOGL|nr:uncharacterized protein LOC106066865 isoform X1 [Biomphalaria glabrata]